MSTARSAETDLYFNGHSVKDTLKDIKQEFTYDDVASGSSDTVSLTLFNSDLRFLNGWLPKKGDRIVAKILLHHWNSEYDEKRMDCGDFLLDEMNMTGGPLVANLGGISLPTDTSIKRTNRTKTWKSTSVKGIGAAIASRYKLAFMYDGPDHAMMRTGRVRRNTTTRCSTVRVPHRIHCQDGLPATSSRVNSPVRQCSAY